MSKLQADGLVAPGQRAGLVGAVGPGVSVPEVRPSVRGFLLGAVAWR